MSALDELSSGRFEPVLDDRQATNADRVILTTGKVYYDLKAARDKASANTAIIRVEQLYPFPQPMLIEALRPCGNLAEVIWVQDEPRNMGAWPFIHERVLAILPPNQKLRYVGRPVAAAPATGSHHRHEAQQAALVKAAIGG